VDVVADADAVAVAVAVVVAVVVVVVVYRCTLSNMRTRLWVSRATKSASWLINYLLICFA